MKKVWYASYPKNVAHDISVDAYQSTIDVVDQTCRHFGARPAFTNMGKTLTFAELEAASIRFASFLQNELLLKPGERIAIQLPNLLQYPIVLFGALRAGLIVVNTNPLYTPREMEHQFRDSGCTAIVILANFASHLEGILANTQIRSVIVTEIGDFLGFPKSWLVNSVIKYVKRMVPTYHLPHTISFHQALQKGDAKKFKPVRLALDDVALLQYTGGTTGVSKGAMLTHRNLIANMEQIAQWMSPLLIEGKEIIITALPMYHIFSFTVNCMAFFKYGALNVLITNPKDIPGFIKELRRWPFTAISGVNTLFNALMNHPDFMKINFGTVKISVAGGMALQRSAGKN
jgi:long-chain acyl-CoA synthetase